MMRSHLLAVTLFIGSLLWGATSQEIDAKIEELQDLKRGYEARAIRAEDQATRLQFEDQFYLEARRYFRIAEANRAKAARIQEEIDRLEAEKVEFMKK